MMINIIPNMNAHVNVFEQNVQNALRYKDEVVHSVNETLANGEHGPSLTHDKDPSKELKLEVIEPLTDQTPEKNADTLLRELDAAAAAQIHALSTQPVVTQPVVTQPALTQPAATQATFDAAGEELKKIMTRGFDDFKRQTGRNMTYSEMRYVYG